jgi:hypothetical protein
MNYNSKIITNFWSLSSNHVRSRDYRNYTSDIWNNELDLTIIGLYADHFSASYY